MPFSVVPAGKIEVYAKTGEHSTEWAIDLDTGELLEGDAKIY